VVLVLKFNIADIAAIGPVANGDEVELTLTGMLLDGAMEIEGFDCIVIAAKGKKGNSPEVPRCDYRQFWDTTAV